MATEVRLWVLVSLWYNNYMSAKSLLDLVEGTKLSFSEKERKDGTEEKQVPAVRHTPDVRSVISTLSQPHRQSVLISLINTRRKQNDRFQLHSQLCPFELNMLYCCVPMSTRKKSTTTFWYHQRQRRQSSKHGAVLLVRQHVLLLRFSFACSPHHCGVVSPFDFDML